MLNISRPDRRLFKLWVCSSEFKGFDGRLETGGLSLAVRDLARSLAGRGHDVSVFLPRVNRVSDSQYLNSIRVGESSHVDLQIQLGSGKRNVSFEIVNAKIDGTNLRFCFTDIDQLFSSREKLYGYGDDAKRYLLFNAAIAKFYQKIQTDQMSGMETAMGGLPDVIHGNDWQTGLLPYFLNKLGIRVPTSSSIHNLEYSSFMSVRDFEHFFPSPHTSLIVKGHIDFIRGLITGYNDLVPVSPKYAEELLTGNTSPHARTYTSLLQQRENDVVGILNGYDYGAVERFIDINKIDIIPEGKKSRRIEFQKIFGLDQDSEAQIITFPGRLSGQKGVLEMVVAMERLLAEEQELQFIVVGSGELKDKIGHLKELFPGRVSLNDFDPHKEMLALAAAKFCLMPSIFEPCGLAQMLALRLGTPVIGSDTGGLSTTIEDGKTGFLFEMKKDHQTDGFDREGRIRINALHIQRTVLRAMGVGDARYQTKIFMGRIG